MFEKGYCLKLGGKTAVTVNKNAINALRSFLPHGLSVPRSKLRQYPACDTPLVIQIWSGKMPVHTYSDIHGQAHYGQISVCSDGIGTNNRIGIRPDNFFLTTKVFLLSPTLMHLNPLILYTEMQRESRQINDYDLSQNNCIDHVIRPIKKAGASFDFGVVSTPRRLSDFCEQMVSDGKGILVKPVEYAVYLRRHPLIQSVSNLQAHER